MASPSSHMAAENSLPASSLMICGSRPGAMMESVVLRKYTTWHMRARPTASTADHRWGLGVKKTDCKVMNCGHFSSNTMGTWSNNISSGRFHPILLCGRSRRFERPFFVTLAIFSHLLCNLVSDLIYILRKELNVTIQVTAKLHWSTNCLISCGSWASHLHINFG